MKKFLKGTYKLDKSIKAKRIKKDASEKFEAKAFKKLGGSIAFISKPKLLWDGKDEKKVK